MHSYGQYPDFFSLRAAFEEKLHKHLQAVKKRSESSRRYRFEHCLRVAAIGRTVAEEAHLDAELLELGCLMHDIGKWDAHKPVDHGRAGALLVYDIATKAGLDPDEVMELAQGIAMHTDGLCNPRPDKEGTKKDAHGNRYMSFTSEPSILARSIGDCDNIDRYSTYRIVDTMEHFKFMDMSSTEQKRWLYSYLGTLKELRRYHCATEAAQNIWVQNLGFQEQFCRRLAAEIEAGTER